MNIEIFIKKSYFSEPTENNDMQSPPVIPQAEIAVASAEDETEANVICEQWISDLLINVFKKIEKKMNEKDKKSTVIPKAEIASISQMDCSSRIPGETITSKNSEPCRTKPQLDLDQNVLVKRGGEF